MMNAFLYWLLPGMIATTYLFWFFAATETEPAKQITVSDTLDGVFLAILGTAFGWLTIIMAIGMTYDEFDVGDIVVWKKKKPHIDKVSDADMLEDLFKRAIDKPSLKQQLAEKFKFEFKEKPIKGLEE